MRRPFHRVDAKVAFSRADGRWRRHGDAFVCERVQSGHARARNIEYFKRSRAVQEVPLSEAGLTAA